MSDSNTTGINRILKKPFGKLSNGEPVALYQLTNLHGNQISITNFGAIITQILFPDASGSKKDIVLGYDNIAGYEDDNCYFGAIIGRYAGRLRGGKITIDNVEYQLPLNTPDSQLHGGPKGLNKQLWQASTSSDDRSATLTLTYLSKDGDQGFPGNVEFVVTYTFNDDNELILDYFAATDKPTIVNLTQHSYFNLAGHQSGDIKRHKLSLNADAFLPMDDNIYPNGDITPVNGLPQDFRSKKYIGDHLYSNDKQVKLANGFDNYWLLNDNARKHMSFAAQVFDKDSKIRLTLYTDQPAMVLYTGNYLDGSRIGKSGQCYQQHAGFCLEPVRAVSKDYINDLTPVMLYPEQPFSSRSRYIFDWA